MSSGTAATHAYGWSAMRWGLPVALPVPALGPVQAPERLQRRWEHRSCQVSCTNQMNYCSDDDLNVCVPAGIELATRTVLGLELEKLSNLAAGWVRERL